MKEALEANGYESLEDYLNQLVEEFDTDINTVEALLDILGEDELFDGLINSLEDYCYY